MIDREIALNMAKELTFQLFTDTTYYTYAHIETDDPMVAMTEEYTFVLDGNVLQVHDRKTDKLLDEFYTEEFEKLSK